MTKTGTAAAWKLKSKANKTRLLANQFNQWLHILACLFEQGQCDQNGTNFHSIYLVFVYDTDKNVKQLAVLRVADSSQT